MCTSDQHSHCLETIAQAIKGIWAMIRDRYGDQEPQEARLAGANVAKVGVHHNEDYNEDQQGHVENKSLVERARYDGHLGCPASICVDHLDCSHL